MNFWVFTKGQTVLPSSAFIPSFLGDAFEKNPGPQTGRNDAPERGVAIPCLYKQKTEMRKDRSVYFFFDH